MGKGCKMQEKTEGILHQRWHMFSGAIEGSSRQKGAEAVSEEIMVNFLQD